MDALEVICGNVYGVYVRSDMYNGRGIPKLEATEIDVRYEGVAGDNTVSRIEKYNGGRMDGEKYLDRAVLIWTDDKLKEMNDEGWPAMPGDLGENIMISGVNYEMLEIGQEYQIGGAILMISRVCPPCYQLHELIPVWNERDETLNFSVDKGPEVVKTLAGRRGYYARVIEEGVVRKGEGVILLS